MNRMVLLAAAAAAFADGALAQSLPEIDINAHCNKVGGGTERIAACIDNEKEARLWLETRTLDPRIVYDCTRRLGAAGYVLFRGCVLQKQRQQ
jgi:hypothetical protein